MWMIIILAFVDMFTWGEFEHAFDKRFVEKKDLFYFSFTDEFFGSKEKNILFFNEKIFYSSESPIRERYNWNASVQKRWTEILWKTLNREKGNFFNIGLHFRQYLKISIETVVYFFLTANY